MGHITVNPLLSPPGSLFFSSTFEGGLSREGGLKVRGGGGAYLIQIHGVRPKIILHLPPPPPPPPPPRLFNTNTRCATKDHFASAGPRSS